MILFLEGGFLGRGVELVTASNWSLLRTGHRVELVTV